MKRVLDIILSVIGLIIAFPVMLVITVLLRVDSSGDTFFSQKRLGKNGKIFKIHKFRKFPQSWGTKGSGVTTQNDVRMTSFGAFLERTKLDELPQLWNILKGEMSFVGPRPESLRYKELFVGEFEQLLNYTPGIFGPNQVAFRNESAMYPVDECPDEFYKRELFPKKARTDINYFSSANIISDIKWMFKSTVGTLFGIVDWDKTKRRYGLVILADFLLFQAAWFMAHVFRFDGFDLSVANKEVYFTGAWLVPLIVFPLMLLGGAYRHPFRYFSVKDVVRLFIAALCSWVMAIFIQFGFFQRNISIGIAILSFILFFGFLVLPRLFRRERWVRENPGALSEQRAALIYGADKKGCALAKFLEQGFDDIRIIGFLDEDADVLGRHINGVKVLGSWRDREVVLSRYNFTELWHCSDYNNISRYDVRSWAKSKDLGFFDLERF